MIDLFGENFKFRLSNGKFEQKTHFGFLLSIIVIIISAMYFIYLLYFYFDNGIPPAITYMNS